MRLFNNMRVSARLMSGFGLLIAALVVVSSVALFQLAAINAGLHELVDNRLRKVQIYSTLKANLLTVAAITRDVVLLNDTAAAARQIEQVAPLRAGNAAIFAELGKTVTSPKGMDLLKIINDNRGAYSKLLDQAMKLGMSGNPEELKAATALLTGEIAAKQALIFKAVDIALKLQQDAADETSQAANHTVGMTRDLILGIAALAIVIGLLVAWSIARGITRALGAEPSQVADAVGYVADGDLTQSIALRAGDDASIMASVKRMQASLRRTVTAVRLGVWAAEGILPMPIIEVSASM